MNLLLDKLPTSVMVNGTEHDIESDFRTAIAYELLMLDEEIELADKILMAVDWFYKTRPNDLETAIEGVLWFYQCGKELPKVGRGGRGSGERIYSFEHDDGYIFAAFLEQYGIDLNQIKYMHWWKFKAMFQALKEDCEFRKIMGYRAIEITNDMDQSRKDFYRSMKEIYRIPLGQNEAEKLNAIENALLNGGDLTELL